MIKKLFSSILALSLIITCLTSNVVKADSVNTSKLEPYAELYGQDLSSLNLKDKVDLLTTVISDYLRTGIQKQVVSKW